MPWWNGKIKYSYLPKAKPHVTRFVPGREGLGLTDRIDSTLTYMVDNNITVLDHNYGLWYERRRDDHERIRVATATYGHRSTSNRSPEAEKERHGTD